MRKRLFIASVACQCVIYIRKRSDLSRNRYLLAFQPVGIAFSVISLVVPATYLIGFVKKGIVVRVMQILKHFRTDDRVSFYNLKFFRRQPSWLVEYLVVYRDFSDIVQGGCCADKQYIIFCKAVLVRLFNQIL